MNVYFVDLCSFMWDFMCLFLFLGSYSRLLGTGTRLSERSLRRYLQADCSISGNFVGFFGLVGLYLV